MALQPILQLISVASDASNITVRDTTGIYSTANPGGFGTPNPIQAVITSIALNFYNILTPAVTIAYLVPNVAAFFAADAVLPASLFSGIGALYPDSVYGIKYQLRAAGANTMSYTTASKQFTNTGADVNFAPGAVGFILASSPLKVYRIDRTLTLNSAGGFVTEALPVTAGTALSYTIVYEGDLKLLIDKAGDRCLTEDIAIWANNGCQDDNFRNIWGRYKQRVALKSKFTQGYINDAQQLALSLASYCDCSVPYTTCNC